MSVAVGLTTCGIALQLAGASAGIPTNDGASLSLTTTSKVVLAIPHPLLLVVAVTVVVPTAKICGEVIVPSATVV